MSMQKKINVSVIGATGYTGLDLVFLLSKHPKIRILNLCATQNLGKKISFFDKRIKNGFGVVMDDVCAGLYVVAVLVLYMVFSS